MLYSFQSCWNFKGWQCFLTKSKPVSLGPELLHWELMLHQPRASVYTFLIIKVQVLHEHRVRLQCERFNSAQNLEFCSPPLNCWLVLVSDFVFYTNDDINNMPIYMTIHPFHYNLRSHSLANRSKMKNIGTKLWRWSSMLLSYIYSVT